MLRKMWVMDSLIRGVRGDQQVPNDEKKYPNIINYAQTSTPDLFIFRNMQ
jgi:hypothetical protein